jgi:hypothetical protein
MKYCNQQYPPFSVYATTCIAHLKSRLALLRIVAIAHYYASSRLARRDLMRTLQVVQLRIPG